TGGSSTPMELKLSELPLSSPSTHRGLKSPRPSLLFCNGTAQKLRLWGSPLSVSIRSWKKLHSIQSSRYKKVATFDPVSQFLPVGRYKSPDEHPFFPDGLPEPMLPPMRYPKVLHPIADSININKKIWEMYFCNLLPRLVREGSDGNCGSSAVCDTICLQDSNQLVHLLTYESVETAIKQRVEAKVMIFGQEVTVGMKNGAPPVYKIKPSLVAELYGNWIMPLTKEVQVEYLLHRLD
ncbi:hypothetical protein BHM03_00014322, partial [Ensete ventricosum]